MLFRVVQLMLVMFIFQSLAVATVETPYSEADVSRVVRLFNELTHRQKKDHLRWMASRRLKDDRRFVLRHGGQILGLLNGSLTANGTTLVFSTQAKTYKIERISEGRFASINGVKVNITQSFQKLESRLQETDRATLAALSATVLMTGYLLSPLSHNQDIFTQQLISRKKKCDDLVRYIKERTRFSYAPDELILENLRKANRNLFWFKGAFPGPLVFEQYGRAGVRLLESNISCLQEVKKRTHGATSAKVINSEEMKKEVGADAVKE